MFKATCKSVKITFLHDKMSQTCRMHAVTRTVVVLTTMCNGPSSWIIDSQGPETPLICFLTVAECPSYTAVHRWWPGLPCCCCPYLEQSAPTCHIHTLYVCFQGRLKAFPSGVPSHDFYRNFCMAPAQWQTVVIFGHLNSSFYLLTDITERQTDRQTDRDSETDRQRHRETMNEWTMYRRRAYIAVKSSSCRVSRIDCMAEPIAASRGSTALDINSTTD